MKNFINKLEYYFDYYVAYFLYNGNKRDRYHAYMRSKYGSGSDGTDHK